MTCRIEILPHGLITAAQEGETLKAVLARAGVLTDYPCGGNGRCGKCAVVIRCGAEPPVSVLACVWRVRGDLTVIVPEPLSAQTRVHAELAGADASGARCGVSFDVGTTTIAGSLVDLDGGEVFAADAAENSQKRFGADVLSRLSFAGQAGGTRRLRECLLSDCNRILRRLARACRILPEQIESAVFAGNTVMTHLLLGVYPARLASAPFQPEFLFPPEPDAATLGLAIHPRGKCRILPCVGGYVGGDTTAAMLGTRMTENTQLTLLIDIGTNCELVLGSRALGFAACAAAAGPAFEGAHITHGMRAGAGAVSAVKIALDVCVETIGNAPAEGICGSGLISAAAQLLQAGILTHKGAFVSGAAAAELPPALRERLCAVDGRRAFLLARQRDGAARDIVITQNDIREVQLAKGAILAGINALCGTLGVRAAEIEAVIIAGAFGSCVDPESALRIGLFPDFPPQILRAAGNAALCGAVLAQSAAEYREAVRIAGTCRYTALSGSRAFQTEFIRSVNFPNRICVEAVTYGGA